MQQPRLGGIINFPIRDLTALKASYMPYVLGGGLFVPSNRPVALGDELFVVTSMPDSPERIPLTGKVIWISHRSNAHRPAGFGIQLTGDEGTKFKNKAEKMLVGQLTTEGLTYTL